MMYHSETLMSDTRRVEQVETTNLTAQAIEAVVKGLEGRAALVSSSQEVQRLINSSKLKVIFVLHGPKNSTDNGLTALDTLHRNPNFSQASVVLISEFPLDAKKIAMYKERGASDVIDAGDLEPDQLLTYINNSPRPAASAA